MRWSLVVCHEIGEAEGVLIACRPLPNTNAGAVEEIIVDGCQCAAIMKRM